MNQKNKKIIAITVILLIIIAGIAVVSVWGFNKEVKFLQGQKIEVNVEQVVDQEKIKDIAEEVLGMHNIVQTVEIYEDVVAIRGITISEEQKNSIVNKMKEIYEFEQTAENTKVTTVPETRFRDMYKEYVLPFVISGVFVAVYMVIRYYKKGIIKVFAKSLIIPAVAELLLLSWMAIVRIPVGRFTPVLLLLIYVASIWYTMKEVEK